MGAMVSVSLCSLLQWAHFLETLKTGLEYLRLLDEHIEWDIRIGFQVGL